MSAIVIKELTREFAGFRALDAVSATFEDGGFYGLLGPSGSGKTTLLRLIAGFDFPNSGRIAIGGDPVENVPVEKRDVGMMFQNYALFPNMSVYENIAFGLKVRGLASPQIRQKVQEVLDLVKLAGLEKRKPQELSGGQKQRVALARAIVFRPRVLLLDEPLSALDKSLRLDMQVELKRIQREVGITTIFVTHDQEEALTLSDRIGILNHGRLVQQGSPYTIYENPESSFAASFLGEANLFSACPIADRPAAADDQDCYYRLEDGCLIAAASPRVNGQERFVCAVRPEKMRLLASGETPAASMNLLPGRVLRHVFAGTSLTYEVQWGEQVLKVFTQNDGADVLEPNARVNVVWPARHTIVMRE